MDEVDKFLALPPRRRRIKRRKPVQHRLYSRDELINFAKDNKVTSLAQFKRLCDGDSEKPSLSQILHEFGTWGGFSVVVYGYVNKTKPKMTDEQLLALIIRFDVRTIAQFESMHQKEPDIIPSMKRVKKQFGTWGNLRRLAVKRMTNVQLEKYLMLKLRLGKTPSKNECKEADINIEYLLSIMSKRELSEFVSDLEQFVLRGGKP